MSVMAISSIMIVSSMPIEEFLIGQRRDRQGGINFMMFSGIGDRIGQGLSQIAPEIVEFRRIGHVDIEYVQYKFSRYDYFYDLGLSAGKYLKTRPLLTPAALAMSLVVTLLYPFASIRDSGSVL